MFGNDFKIMIRNLLKNKAFAFINIFGLATGMAVCLLLTLYIRHELGYDNFHEKGDRIYRLALERKYPARSAWRSDIPMGIGAAAKQIFPEVEQYTRVMALSPEALRIFVGDRNFKEPHAMTVDSNFFQVFSGHFLQGDIHTALNTPNSVVLNETTAIKYFGSAANAIGKTIHPYNMFTWTITGVCQDWPEKSHLPFNILLSATGDDYWRKPEYVYFGASTYLLLKPHTSAQNLDARLPSLVDKYVASVVPRLFGETWSQFLAEGNGYHYFLQSIKDIHLHSTLEDELMPSGSAKSIILLTIIATFILALAGVNFVNLSTVLAAQRAKEIGIRKTFGSRKWQLTLQFLGESVFLSLLSVCCALILAAILTPLLNRIAEQHLHVTDFLHPLFLLAILGFAVLTGILAGLYPALTLSGYDPITVLKGRFKSSQRGLILRNGLVVFQFSISITLIICTIVINRQMQYMLQDPGFKKEHIISIDGVWRLTDQVDKTDARPAFFNEIARIPGVTRISKCSELPFDNESATGSTWVTQQDNISRTQHLIQADEQYFSMLDLHFVQGRPFSRSMATDSLGVVLNETAVADFGLKKPIGARLISKEQWLNTRDGKTQNVFTVIGVVKDFHYQSMRKKIAPLVIINADKFEYGMTGVAISGDKLAATLAGIGEVWKKLSPNNDFLYTFLDQDLAAKYQAEQTQQRLFSIFAGLAIFIGCIGLFGLSAFTIRQRMREISIRKVLGAMPGNIMLTLSRDFLILVAVSALIAIPVGGWAMHQWLQNYAYRTPLSWWIFALAAALAIGIAILTISYQAIRAARTNPINALRAE